MHSLLSFAISWISFTIGYSMSAPRSLEDLNTDYFWDVPVDPNFIDNELSAEQKSPLDQTTDPYSNMFEDNHDRYPITEPEINVFTDDVDLSEMTGSSFLLADDSFCGLGDIDETDSVHKVRREAFCQDPSMSQVKPRIRSKKKNVRQSDLRFFYKDPMVMEISEAMCPPEIFGTSTLPTCLTTFDGRSIPVPGQDWFNLEDVFRTSANDLI